MKWTRQKPKPSLERDTPYPPDRPPDSVRDAIESGTVAYLEMALVYEGGQRVTVYRKPMGSVLRTGDTFVLSDISLVVT